MANAWGVSWGTSWGVSWGAGTPVATGKKPGAFRRLRINHIFLRDDPIEELPKPTKKRIKVVQKAVLAEAAGLLGHQVPPRVQEQVRKDVRQAYTPQVDPGELEDLLAEILRLTIQRINDEIEAEDEEMLLMAI